MPRRRRLSLSSLRHVLMKDVGEVISSVENVDSRHADWVLCEYNDEDRTFTARSKGLGGYPDFIESITEDDVLYGLFYTTLDLIDTSDATMFISFCFVGSRVKRTEILKARELFKIFSSGCHNVALKRTFLSKNDFQPINMESLFRSIEDGAVFDWSNKSRKNHERMHIERNVVALEPTGSSTTKKDDEDDEDDDKIVLTVRMHVPQTGDEEIGCRCWTGRSRRRGSMTSFADQEERRRSISKCPIHPTTFLDISRSSKVKLLRSDISEFASKKMKNFESVRDDMTIRLHVLHGFGSSHVVLSDDGMTIRGSGLEDRDEVPFFFFFTHCLV
jgi:hypothetical protein